jgi:hypothetical protein
MSKKFRFYTQEEKALLQQFAESKLPVNRKMLGQFCKENKRSHHSATMKVYEFRKKLGIENSRPPRVKKVIPTATVVKDSSTAKLSKGEFKIPVNNWNITNENGQMYLTVKF